MRKAWPLLVVFTLALVLNPYLACRSSKQELGYAEADLKQAVLSSWVGTADVDGESVEFSLVLERASLEVRSHADSAHEVQCSQRSLVKAAAACIQMSRMLIIGALTSVHPALNGAVDGEVRAYQDLDRIELALRLEDGKQLSGVIEAQALSDGRITNEARIGSFALTRP